MFHNYKFKKNSSNIILGEYVTVYIIISITICILLYY